jgi:arylesterase/paraoxonase
VRVRRLLPLAGAEDITIDHAAGRAYISSEDRWKAGKTLQPAGIYGLDLADDRAEPINLTADPPSGFVFHPHGLSLFCGDTDERRLFVINHRGAEDHGVEVFDVDGDRLRHIRTIADRQHLISPNDLVALDGDRFYVTNDHGSHPGLLRTLEDVAGLAWSTVVFWDGHRFHTVAGRMAFANGIALDRDRGRLYVAGSRDKTLLDFAWDAGDPAKMLSDPEEIGVPGCPDNLEWDEDGNLWVGAHPSFLKLALYTARIKPTAPSLVLCLHFEGGETPRVEEVWRDETGATISASSVAAVHGTGAVRRLLIGAPFDDHFLDCEMLT